MSTVTLRDALDDLEQTLARARGPRAGLAWTGGLLRAAEEDDDEDLFGEDDLGFDDIDEEEDDELDVDEDELDADLDDEELDEEA